MNGSAPSEFRLYQDQGSLSSLNSTLSETETTVSVSWSGGGEIKDREPICIVSYSKLTNPTISGQGVEYRNSF